MNPKDLHSSGLQIRMLKRRYRKFKPSFEFYEHFQVLLQRHMIDGRWCDIKIPDSQDKKEGKPDKSSCKIFVGRVTENLSKEDLKDHFETFGQVKERIYIKVIFYETVSCFQVTDVYIPTPFRQFAFVQFSESRVAQSLLGKEHIIKGVSVKIGEAAPKGRDGGHGGRGGDRGGGRFGGYDGGYSTGGNSGGWGGMKNERGGGYGGNQGGNNGGFSVNWGSGGGYGGSGPSWGGSMGGGPGPSFGGMGGGPGPSYGGNSFGGGGNNSGFGGNILYFHLLL